MRLFFLLKYPSYCLKWIASGRLHVSPIRRVVAFQQKSKEIRDNTHVQTLKKCRVILGEEMIVGSFCVDASKSGYASMSKWFSTDSNDQSRRYFYISETPHFQTTKHKHNWRIMSTNPHIWKSCCFIFGVRPQVKNWSSQGTGVWLAGWIPGPRILYWTSSRWRYPPQVLASHV